MKLLLSLLLLFCYLASVAHAQFTFITNGGTITITGYSGKSGNVIIPAVINRRTVTSIKDYAFFGNLNLTNVYILRNITSIGHRAFNYCQNLKAVDVEGQNPAYSSSGGVLFDKWQKQLIVYPNGRPGDRYTIPVGVTNIIDSAFSFNTKLINIKIANSVKSIGFQSFWSCLNITNINIPSNVAHIGEEAFQDCSSLMTISVDSANAFYSSINGVLFDKKQVLLVQCPNGFPGSYTIPNGVTNICNNAFYGCNYLTNIIIPNSVYNIGYMSFAGCTSLTTITIGTGVASIGDYAFAFNGSLESIHFYGNTPTNVGTNIFLFDSNATVYFMMGASGWGTTFGGLPAYLWDFPFNYTINSNSVTISGYTGLDNNLVIPNIINGLPVTSIGDNAFYGANITSVSIPENVISIGNGAFSGCKSLTNVTFFGSVISFGEFAFNNCINLTSIVISTNITKITEGMFDGCSSLATVVIPNSITDIGIVAFGGCTSLSSIFIPDGVTNIESDAFSGSGLTNISIPDSVCNIGDSAFINCYSLKNVKLPKNITGISDETFAQCSELATITIPSGVTNIGYGVFWNCYGLTSIYFDGNTPSIGDQIFYSCSPTIYYLPETFGWSSTFDGRPSVLWNPEAQVGDGSYGVRTNQFGFNIAGSSNLVIVVESCTNLVNPIWSSLSTNTLNTLVGTNGVSYFSDPYWTNYPSRFYRFRSP